MSNVTTRVMEIDTPLGDGVLLFHSMQAHEEIGRLSEFDLELLSAKNDINVDDILGKNVTVKLALPDESTRYFNGFVTRFAQSGSRGKYHRYSAVVRPWLWFLTRTNDCRIFQEKTVPDILKLVFADHPTADFKLELTSAYRTWTYCVQYRESDFDFVSRLMETEGIYYYFRHTNGHNTMVLTDSSSKHTPFPGYEKIQYIPQERLVTPDIEHIASWDFTREIQPGVYVHTDYDLERPSVELKTQKVLPRGYAPSNYEVYDYPGCYLQKGDGEQYASVRIDELGSQFETAQASTNARGLSVGCLFKFDGCPRADQNREQLVLSADYDMKSADYESLPDSSGTTYACSFVAMSSQQQYRPRRATTRPFVHGPQTAVVVGPAGDEIYTDKYGRVKVQFHWDRYGKKDENSSCWIRVSSPWAGKNWGGVSTPRIGQEVVVDFLEGDPDQPIITGRVYNAENLPPFGFPAGAVISGVKSNTHKGAGYNEMSFDDTAGAEKITVHGQFDMNSVIEHDQTLTVHNCRKDRIDVDDSESVGNNQSLTVGANRAKDVTANETITIGGNRSSTVSGSETATVAMQRTHSVGINETISVGAAQEISVGGLQAVTVGALQTINVGANQSTNVGANQSVVVAANRSVSVAGNQMTSVAKNATATIGADDTHSVTGKRTVGVGKDDALSVGKNLVINAGDQVAIVTGSASILMKKDGSILIKGKDITFEGSGKITVKASGDIVMKGSKIVQN